MAYSDFTLENFEARLGVRTVPGNLFPDAPPAEVPAWLTGALASAPAGFVLTEKARSEFLIAPVLAACSFLTDRKLAVFSGTRMDADLEKGLVGVCDFILALGPTVIPLRTPLVAVVEAKNQDIEAGIGQCVAEMAAARKLNEAEGRPGEPVFGCVTTGELWQFMRLRGATAEYDSKRYYIPDVAAILGVFLAIHRECEAVYRPATPPPAP